MKKIALLLVAVVSIGVLAGCRQTRIPYDDTLVTKSMNSIAQSVGAGKWSCDFKSEKTIGEDGAQVDINYQCKSPSVAGANSVKATFYEKTLSGLTKDNKSFSYNGRAGIIVSKKVGNKTRHWIGDCFYKMSPKGQTWTQVYCTPLVVQ
jgi:hypothetical protein